MSGPPVHSAFGGAWTLYSERRRWGFLAVLFLVATSNFLDKNVVSVLLEPIKEEFHVSDAMLGLLSGFSFALFYSLAGIPIARWADRGNRRTIITVALCVWSVLTMLCGLAQTFWQLALVRVGVGTGESGAIPPAHSLLADYFSPERRATAIGIFTASGTAGYLLGFGVGGYIGAAYGWREAFLFAGAPGFLLAVLTRTVLVEPRLQLGFPGVRAPRERLGEALNELRRKKSFLCILAGCVLYTFVVQGGLMFIPAFLIRVQHASLAQVSITFGAVAAAASIVGTLGGGWLGDRLGASAVRWLAWLPAIVCALGGPLLVLAFSVESLRMFMAIIFLALLLLFGGLPPILAAAHAVCGSARRAVAIAAVFFVSTLFGGGFGPLVTGVISDALSSNYGVEGLRYSLMIVVNALVGAAAMFYACGRTMAGDLEN